jgi:dipeptide/tripeptide permease
VILAQLGFDNVQSMVLNVPPNAWSVIPALITAYIADKYRHMRAAVIVFSGICLIVGTAMYSQLGATQKVARYAGIFLAVQGGNCNVPLVLSWAQTSIRAQSKRAFMAAVVVCFGGIGGILASVAFNQNEAKKGYRSGVIFTMAINAVTVVGAVILHLWMRNENRRAEQHGKVLEEDENFRYQG